MKRHTWQSGLNDGKSDVISRPAQPPISCPECGCERIWKDGLRSLRDGRKVQRYSCRLCGFRFSKSTANGKVEVDITSQVLEKPDSGENLLQADVFQSNFSPDPSPENLALKRREDVASHGSSEKTIIGKLLNTFPDYNRERRVCETEAEGSKNLVTVEETRTEKWAAGAALTQAPDQVTIKGKLLQFAWWMKKDVGYADKTIKNRSTMINRLIKLGANLYDQETIKEILAKPPVNWSEAYKQLLIDTYSCFLQMEGLTWKPPKIRRPDTAAFIPTETEVDQLINAAGKILGAFLQGLKDTGTDPGELKAIKWTDIDQNSRTVRINHPVKGHNARILPVSKELIERLNALPKKGEKIFRPNIDHGIQTLRKRLAHNLGNARLLKISFKSFRHWKGTIEYHRTKDIYYVKDLLGHKKLSSTQVYVHYERAIYRSLSNKDEFTVRVATNVEESCALVETGFEYVTGEYNDGGKIFRKRK